MSERFVDHPKLHIDYLPDELGFTETPEMADARSLAVEAKAAHSADSDDPIREYLRLGRQVVNELPRDQHNAARIGLEIARATIYRDASRAHYDGDLLQTYVDNVMDVIDDLNGLIHGGKEEFTDTVTALRQAVAYEYE